MFQSCSPFCFSHLCRYQLSKSCICNYIFLTYRHRKALFAFVFAPEFVQCMYNLYFLPCTYINPQSWEPSVASLTISCICISNYFHYLFSPTHIYFFTLQRAFSCIVDVLTLRRFHCSLRRSPVMTGSFEDLSTWRGKMPKPRSLIFFGLVALLHFNLGSTCPSSLLVEDAQSHHQSSSVL